MSRQYFHIYLLILPFLLYGAQSTANTFTLTDGFSRIMLGNEVSVLKDDENTLKLDDVLSLSSEAFEKWDSEVFHLGFSESAYWLKFDLENPMPETRSLIVEIVNPYLFEFHFHELGIGGQIVSDTVGTRFNFNQRKNIAHRTQIPHRNFQFQLTILPGERSTCYVYFPPSRGHLNFDLYLWETTYRNTWQQRFEDYILTSFFLLCLLYMLLLGVAIYITGFSYYWYYFFYVFLGTLLVFSDLGLSFRYLWGNSPFFQQIALIIIANLYIVFGTLFIRELLKTKGLYPYLDKILQVIIWTALMVIPFSFIMPGIINLQFSHLLSKFQNILVIAACIVFFILLFVALFRHPETFSGLFLFGFSLHGISLIFASLQDVNLLPGGVMPALLMDIGYPVTFYTQVTLMVGILLEMAIVFYIAIGLFRKMYHENNEMLRDLAIQKQKNMDDLVMVVEGERKRIAQELHDGLGVMLSSAKMRLNVLKDKLPEKGTEDLDSIISDLDASHQEVRSISHNLMPKSLQKLGFEAAVQEQIHRLEGVGVKINYYKNISLSSASDLAQVYLFRILQELLNNVMTHSKATELNLQFIKLNEQLLLTLEDNGIGFNPTHSKGGGIGLQNVQQRVKGLGGVVHFDSIPAKGTTISIEIPLENVFKV